MALHCGITLSTGAVIMLLGLPLMADTVAEAVDTGTRLVASAPPSVPAPQRIHLEYSAMCGDRVRVDRTLTTNLRQTTLRNGDPEATVADLATHHYRYSETVLALGPSGRLAAVRRTYEVARHSSMHDGRDGTLMPWDLEGKTVTVRSHAGIATISGVSAPRGDECSVLDQALDDDVERFVLSGDRAVGDEWEMPRQLPASGLPNATCRGRAKLAGFAMVSGIRCARITFRAHVSGVDLSGRRVTLEVAGATSWSPDLRRTVACTYEGSATTDFDTQQGADMVTVSSTGTVKLARRMNWLQIDGRQLTKL